jgi:hypothetical protein
LDNSLNQEEIQQKLLQVQIKTNEMLEEGREIKNLLEIRRLLVDFSIVEIAPFVDSHTLTVIYLVKKILADVWVNLGTDATFEMKEVKNELTSFAYHLARFLQAAFAEPTPELERLWLNLTEMIQNYTDALESVQSRIFQYGGKKGGYIDKSQ